MDKSELLFYLKIQYSKIEENSISEQYKELYQFFDREEYPYALELFAYWHEKINSCFELLNQYISEGRDYFHADNSRLLLYVFNNAKTIIEKLQKYDIYFNLEYKKEIDKCLKFLMPTRGSTIPNGMHQVEILYIPIFFEKNTSKNNSFMKKIKLIDEGSYAKVYKYFDENYNTYFAYKKLNKNATEKEKTRFQQEYEIMKSYQYPYVLSVYSYFEKQKMYIMEYMDYNLKKFIEHNNNKISFKVRKSIALQVLKGVAFLHEKGILHRDLSYNNILLKSYDDLIVVKICDFGLAKSDYKLITTTKTSIKGTYIDPALDSFANYDIQNEIYSLGFILWYIFTGKQNFNSNDSVLSRIIEKCISIKKEDRYNNVNELISDLSKLKSINDNTNFEDNNISILKDKIINYLANESANELPDICESLGLKSGTISEAYKSKSSYVRKRIYGLDYKTTCELIEKIKNSVGVDLI